MTKHNKI